MSVANMGVESNNSNISTLIVGVPTVTPQGLAVQTVRQSNGDSWTGGLSIKDWRKYSGHSEPK